MPQNESSSFYFSNEKYTLHSPQGMLNLITVTVYFLIPLAFICPHTVILLIVGGSCNLLAVKFNNYKMPVKLDISSDKYCTYSKDSKFKALCDIISFKDYFMSVGDVIIYCGLFISVYDCYNFLSFFFHQ